MRKAIFIVFGFAFLCGLYLVVVSSYYILIIGLLSILFAYLYTAGPFPLAYNGLGDLFVFLFFGPVALLGTFYVYTLKINYEVFFYSIAMGLLVANILVVNNFRDIETDKQAGKKTLSVIIGEKFTAYQYLLFFLFAECIIILMSIKLGLNKLFPVILLPLSFTMYKQLKERKSLNQLLAKTALFAFLFGILIVIGEVL